MPRDEGYIKFDCEWIEGAAPPWHKLSALNDWRQLMHKAGLIGMYPDGIGFGNISVRDVPLNEFIITGTATGAEPSLTRNHFTRVIDYNLDENRVTCRGPIRASSESLTHAAFYESSHSIKAVIHIHHRYLWDTYLDKLPTTSRDVAYGTPEMAYEVRRLLSLRNPRNKQLVIMGGHEEGVMAYGASISQAASILLNCCDSLFRQ